MLAHKNSYNLDIFIAKWMIPVKFTPRCHLNQQFIDLFVELSLCIYSHILSLPVDYTLHFSFFYLGINFLLNNRVLPHFQKSTK
jgi:hypothetical protein